VASWWRVRSAAPAGLTVLNNWAAFAAER
jgi:hypothetical protein